MRRRQRLDRQRDQVLSESTFPIDRLVKLDEHKAIETMDYIVIADPTRIEVGLWFRDAARGWRTATFQDTDAVVDMPALGLAVSVASLDERVPLPPRPRPRLVRRVHVDAAARFLRRTVGRNKQGQVTALPLTRSPVPAQCGGKWPASAGPAEDTA